MYLATVRGVPNVLVGEPEKGVYWSAQAVLDPLNYYTHAHKEHHVTDLNPVALVMNMTPKEISFE